MGLSHAPSWTAFLTQVNMIWTDIEVDIETELHAVWCTSVM